MPETTPLIKAALNLRVGAGFDVYRHLYHRVGNRTGFCTFYGITEQPVLTSYCERPDGILTKVFGEAAVPVLQIGHGCFPRFFT